ncbi:MAG: T9SS type A sorting domain-containing protein [Bacteroidales bacterium]|nr:T9SS type A sorting domain-containing protein [Bacteroidales bacterium]
MKKVLLFLIVIFLIDSLSANPVDTSIAKQVAVNFYNNKSQSKTQKSLRDFILVYEANSLQKAGNNQPLYYIFNAGNTGFVIVAANDQVKPVLGYSTEGIFDLENTSPATAEWLDAYKKEIQYVVENEIPATASITQAWQELKSGNLLRQKALKSSGSPMITTKWGQGNRYNSQCPYDANARAYCVTGCVVVAMSQVMNYWEHPVKGLGSNSYVDNPYGVLSADFENTTYQFDSMPNALYSSTPATQIYAVALLMHHCGVGIEIEYGVYGSDASLAEYTAGSPSAELALKTYFGYPDVIGLDRSQFSDSQWVNIIKNEIDSGRPVLYRGSGDVGGHAFVFDAYNDSDYFHINWGWTGYADGYFLVSALNPMSYSFPNGHYILINIKPTPYTIIPDSNHIVYISPTGAGNKDGSSWSNASPHLAFAMQRKYSQPTQIWVKEGVYYGDTNLETAFQLSANNSVYGGFAGNEHPTYDLSLRDLSFRPTILDGQNKQRVLSMAGATDTNRSLCNGFIIQNGFCNEGGAGVYMNGGRLMHCIVKNNVSDSGYGGGVYVRKNAHVINCLLHHNKAVFGGGAIVWDTSYFINCDLVSNQAVSNGGGLYNGDTCFVNNCIFWGNKRNTTNNQIAGNSSTLTEVAYSAIQGSYAGTANINLNVNNDGNDTSQRYVRFVNPDSNNYKLQPNSVCVDAGDTQVLYLSIYDLAGSNRIKLAQIDIGSYEYGCVLNQMLKDTVCMGDVYQKNGFNYTPDKKGIVLLVERYLSHDFCDSVVQLELVVFASDTTFFEDAICLGNAYNKYGFDTLPTRQGTMILQRNLTNVYGCDSVIEVSLKVIDADTTFLNHNLCYGDAYLQNGFAIHSDTLTPGRFQYQQFLTNVYGCDSVVLLNLSVWDMDIITVYDTICKGEVYDKFGMHLSTGFITDDTVKITTMTTNQYGCDSIFILYLKLQPLSDTIIHGEVVKGELYQQNGFVIATDTVGAGLFHAQRSMLNQYGCDSVIYLTLNVSLAIKEQQETFKVMVYPNPAHNYIDIQFSSVDLRNKEMELSDITGKLLKKQILNRNVERMDLSELTKGMYFLTIKGDNHVLKILKIIKQ